VAIVDNGIGRAAAQKTGEHKHLSAATAILHERIALYKGVYTDDISLIFKDISDSEAGSGTGVYLTLPLQMKKR
jgi:hypothetical protein